MLSILKRTEGQMNLDVHSRLVIGMTSSSSEVKIVIIRCSRWLPYENRQLFTLVLLLQTGRAPDHRTFLTLVNICCCFYQILLYVSLSVKSDKPICILTSY